jgi:hypothetical protein
MTALNRNPSNPNMLQGNKFTLNLSRAPNIQYFCQTVTLPGISTSEIPVQNPFVELYAPGEKAIYDTLNITFLVDAEMTAWLEIHDWLRALTFPTDYEEYRNLGLLNKFTTAANSKTPQYTDGSVTILSAANKPYFKINFIDMFPISLGGFVMSATDTPETIITSDATFRFTYFDVEKLI